MVKIQRLFAKTNLKIPVCRIQKLNMKCEICREQTLYAHFQQRKFLKISTCNLEHYLIVPNRIIDYQKVTIDNLKMWTRSQELKRRLYNLKNRINHRLNIIFK